MAQTTHITRLGINAPSGSFGPKIVPLTVDGFPRLNLQTLFKLDEATLALGFKDTQTGIRYGTQGLAIDANNTEGIASGGGGYRTKGVRSIQGPPINITLPWTVIYTFTKTVPANVASSGRVNMTVGSPGVAGVYTFCQGVNDPTVLDGDMAVGGQYKSAAGLDFMTGIGAPYIGKLGRSFTESVSYNGSNQLTHRIYRGGLMAKSTTAVVEADLDGAGSTPIQTVSFGCNHLTIANGEDTFDVCGIYDRDINDDEFIKWGVAGQAWSVARGRS